LFYHPNIKFLLVIYITILLTVGHKVDKAFKGVLIFVENNGSFDLMGVFYEALLLNSIFPSTLGANTRR
jgi:hypothetical protein